VSEEAPITGRAALARSGVAMATGTLASRGTGFVRTVVIAYALGVGGVNNAYTVANTVPNALYDLLLGGVLSALVIPLLVQAAHDEADDGEAFAQRLVTIVAVVLTVVAIVAVLIAPWVISVYAHNARPAQKELAVTFARYFLPQLLFYGLGAILGAILNIRGSFTAPMWAPVLNNLVVIGSGIGFAVITHTPPHAGHLSQTQILILALGTTAGVVLQTVALLPALRHVGMRLKPRWDWRHAGLRRAGPFAGWVLGYVLTNQLGYVVICDLAAAIDDGRGQLAIYSYGFLLFSLPYAVIGVTVITALFPAMSRSGAAGDDAAIAHTLAEGLTLSGVVLVPATLLLVTLGTPIAVLVLAHGHTTLSGAELTGRVLIAFGAGLVPFSAFQMQLRAWLAVHDSRTPMLVNLWITGLNLAVDVLLYAVLPSQDKVVGLAAGYSISYAVGTVVFAAKLRRRFTATQPTHVIRTHVRLIVAALVAAVPTMLLITAVGHGVGPGPGGSLITIVAAAPVGIATFVLLARRMRIAELQQLVGLLPVGRFRR
jgi:putative peptidoglycan lipid II flippase